MEAWHKVCADRLPVLVKWAEDRERMENSPKIQPCARCGAYGLIHGFAARQITL